MRYQEAIDYLYTQLPMFQREGKKAYKANLDNIISLCSKLGNPQKSLTTIHVAGSNGKGSSSHLLCSILMEAGYKVGLFTSPHLKDYRERIKINGKNISEEAVVKFVLENKKNFEIIKPSFFEMSTSMAFHQFAIEEVDIAVIETGLGGRLDSTNIIDPEISLITNIGFDHMDILGDTLEKIAFEKAGIIKRGKPVVIGEFKEETANVFIEKAKEMHTEVHFASKVYEEESIEVGREFLKIKYKEFPLLNCPLKGLYQVKNLKGVLLTLQILNSKKWKISKENIQMGVLNVLKNTDLMGRWQTLSEDPWVICDTGHNVDGIKEVLNNLKFEKFNRLHFVIGMVADKDIDGVLELLPKDAIYYFTNADIPRAMNAMELMLKGREYGLMGEWYNSTLAALEAAKGNALKGDLIFIGGSTFVVAELI